MMMMPHTHMIVEDHRQCGDEQKNLFFPSRLSKAMPGKECDEQEA
jgi:hypothetical protein